MSNVLRSLIVRVGADLSDFDKSLKTMSRDLKSAGKELTKTGKELTMGLTLPIAAVGATALNSSIDFESAFAGVRKTVDATESQFEALNQGIRDMAKEMPMAATEIAKIAESAGQLGIETDNILKFSKTMADLGVATNLTGEEAASTFAKFANITKMPQTEFDKLGSTIVALGNNLATTERDIAEMGLRLAGAGKQIKLTEAQTLSFAGALSSVGIEAEAGGSAFSKVMINMQLAVETGSDDLNRFAAVAGMTAEDFQKAFKEDAAGAIIAFIKGLGESEKKGMSAIKVLDDMGISEVRMRDALLRAAGASDVFTGALELGSKAWEENTALTKEAEQRYSTTQSGLEILKNKLKDVGITLGDALIPAFTSVLEAIEPFLRQIGKMAESFANADEGTQKFILTIAGIAAGLGPALMAIGKLTTGLSGVVGNVGKAAKVLGKGGGFVSALSALIGPTGIVILAGAAIAGLVLAIKNVVDRDKELFAEVNKVKEAHDNLNQALEEADSKYQKESEAIMSNALEAELLTKRLKELGDQTRMTAGDKEEYASIVARLNELYPDLNLLIDEETGKINLSTEAILSNIEAMKQKALTEALQERLTEKTKAYVNASIEAEKAERVLAQSEEELRLKQNELQNAYVSIAAKMGLTIEEFDKLDGKTRGYAIAGSDLRDKINELKGDIVGLQVTLPKLKKEKESLIVTVNNTKTAIEEETVAAQAAIDKLKAFGAAGANAGQALADGLTSKKRDVIDAALGLANAAKQTVGMKLEIQSPSKVFTRLGAYVSEGFASGINKGIDGIKRVASELSMAVMPDFDTTQLSTPMLPAQQTMQLAGANGYSTANIIVELDGHTLAKAVGQPLVDLIRLKTGVRM